MRSLRALPGLLRSGFVVALAYRSQLAVWVLTTTTPLVMLALWTAVAREAPVGRFGERGFAAYFVVTLGVRLLTGSWVVWEMNDEIRQGTIATRLLRPVHPFLHFAAGNLGVVLLRALVVLPLVGGALAWGFRAQLSGDAAQWALLPLALAGAWAINFASMALIGALGLYWESSLALHDLWLGLFVVFSGYLMPIELLPAGLYRVVRWLPFRYMLSFPVETALGLAGRQATVASLAVQWGYAAALLALALRVWRAGLARFEAFGG